MSGKEKIFKVVRKTIGEDKDNFVVRWKNLDKKTIRALKHDLNEFCSDYLAPKTPTKVESP